MRRKMQRWHVHARVAQRFADYYIEATTWEAACNIAKRLFRKELPRGAKHLADWASFSS